MTVGVDDEVARLSRQLHETGEVEASLRWVSYAFLIVSSGAFTALGVLGLVANLGGSLGWVAPPSGQDLGLAAFFTLVPGALCLLFTWTWLRERHPVRVTSSGVVLSRVGLVADIPWSDVVGAAPRSVGGVGCLEVVVSEAWFERHRSEHHTWIRRRVGRWVVRPSAVVGGGTTPPGWVLAAWIDHEARRRGAAGTSPW